MKRKSSLLIENFVVIEDPRAGNSRHPIGTVLFCLLVGILCGATGFIEAAHEASLRKSFIKKYVSLRGKVPSHDTMGRLVSLLDPIALESTFIGFMSRLAGNGKHFALDGKALRGVVGTAAMKRDRSKAAKAQTQMVSLFSSTKKIVLGQLKTADSVNEVAAGQELLQLVDISGGIVTADAMHLNHRTLEVIAEQDAHAVITVKANAPSLDKAMRHAFRYGTPVARVVTEEEERGRVARRIYEFFAATPTNFPSLKTFVKVTRENVSHDKPQKKANVTKYAATLEPEQAQMIADVVRGRWSIENEFHYVLDVTFMEDRSRVRVKHAAENLSRLRRLAFNLLSLVKTTKELSFGLKIRSCAGDEKFLARALRLPRR